MVSTMAAAAVAVGTISVGRSGAEAVEVVLAVWGLCSGFKDLIKEVESGAEDAKVSVQARDTAAGHAAARDEAQSSTMVPGTFCGQGGANGRKTEAQQGPIRR